MEACSTRPGWEGERRRQFHIVGAFGRNPAFYVDVIDTVTRLDATGFTAVTYSLGQEVAHLNHDFVAVEGDTQYLSTLTIGSTLQFIGKFFNAGALRCLFTEAMGCAWLQHNVEEVGLLEHIIPDIHAGLPNIRNSSPKIGKWIVSLKPRVSSVSRARVI